MKVGLVPAAGLGTRLGLDTPKELVEYRGKPIIEYSLDNLIASGMDRIVVVIRSEKEAVRDFLLKKYPARDFTFVYQTGVIGNLLDAIKAASEHIRGHNVYFCMADTHIQPNPFEFEQDASAEITLLCFEVDDDRWKHFGVLDLARRRLVDKPSEYVGNVCWGALVWQPKFTERLLHADLLPAAINAADWDYRVNIKSYTDIGVA
ncbi:MAG: NTP transferase domain-containing protein [Anaerolineales bacterium]